MCAAAATALAGELFGKNRAMLLFIALAIPAGWLIAAVWLSTMHRSGAASDIPVALTVGGILAFRLACPFCYVDLDSEAMNKGFPRHILVLPAPTWLLALVPIVTGASLVTLFAVLWLHFVAHIELDWIQLAVIAGTIAAALSWAQALLWKLVPTVVLQMLVFGVVANFTLYSAASLLMTQGNHLLGKTDGTLGLVSSLLEGWYCAYRAVVLSRRGDTTDKVSYLRRPRLRAPLRSRPQAPVLSSGAAAQTWFEWHVFGFWLPLLSLSEFVLLLPRAFEKWHTSVMMDILMLSVFFLMMVLVVGSLYAQQSPTSRSDQLSAFHAALPLSNLELAFAKLRLTVNAHLLGSGVLLAAFATVILTSSDNSELVCQWSWLETHVGSTGALFSVFLLSLFVAAMTWATTVYMMSMRLFIAGMSWKGARAELINAALLALTFLIWPVEPTLGRHLSDLSAWAESAHLAVLIPATLIMASGLALLPRFRRLNPVSELKGVAIAFCIALAACLILIWQLNLSIGYRWAFSWLAVAAAGVTFIPCLLVPVLIGLQRHR